MPAAAPTSEFSFERDIQPHANRFFNEIEADGSLTPEQKAHLKGSLLGGIEGIKEQRMKYQEEKEQGRARKLDYESSMLRLEDARARRTRLEQMEQRRVGLTDTAKSILDSPDDTETKRQVLARTALDYADDPEALKVFDTAKEALPEPKSSGLTPNQIADFTSRIGEYVTPEELPAVLGDPMLLGQVLGKVAKVEEEKVATQKILDEVAKKGQSAKLELAKMPLKWQKPDMDGDDPMWLEDSSTAIATKVVEELGTPEEQARFAKLKTAGSDRERALMVELIQLRHRFDTEKVGGGGLREKAASRIWGE